MLDARALAAAMTRAALPCTSPTSKFELRERDPQTCQLIRHRRRP